MDLLPSNTWNLIFHYAKINDTKLFVLRLVCKRLKFLISNYVYNTKFQKLKRRNFQRILSTDLYEMDKISVTFDGGKNLYNVLDFMRMESREIIGYFWVGCAPLGSHECMEPELNKILDRNRKLFVDIFLPKEKVMSMATWPRTYRFGWDKLIFLLTETLMECKYVTKMQIIGTKYQNGSSIEITRDFFMDTVDQMELWSSGMYNLCCAIEEGQINP